jgi:hypothetical protein
MNERNEWVVSKIVFKKMFELRINCMNYRKNIQKLEMMFDIFTEKETKHV